MCSAKCQIPLKSQEQEPKVQLVCNVPEIKICGEILGTPSQAIKLLKQQTSRSRNFSRNLMQEEGQLRSQGQPEEELVSQDLLVKGPQKLQRDVLSHTRTKTAWLYIPLASYLNLTLLGYQRQVQGSYQILLSFFPTDTLNKSRGGGGGGEIEFL